MDNHHDDDDRHHDNIYNKRININDYRNADNYIIVVIMIIMMIMRTVIMAII